ncbi:MAG: glucosamine-6-phosphate deaminase [Clostridium sp.]
MKVQVEKNYEEMSRASANHIINYVNRNKNALLCLAGGDTPLKTFEYLIEAEKENKVDFKECSFVSLDEWGGLGPETKGSCVETLYNHLYNKLNIDVKSQVCFFNGKEENLEEECKRVDEFILSRGGIDISLLGIGMNGHIGFNEPGAREEDNCIVVPLDPITKTVGAKYFEEELDLKVGITIGLKHLLASKNVILIANHKKKADIVKATVEGDITNEVPSSLVRKSDNSFIYLDEEAASNLTK